jgi:hypothetical protein
MLILPSVSERSVNHDILPPCLSEEFGLLIKRIPGSNCSGKGKVELYYGCAAKAGT